ncbi:hypothetical protein TVAG_302420 [Trichomonas vaginalis G3]|uniref:Uncharacterized protein n=1 Tax=Trichomonas vaginalis (strain ATCC PRA-98 / G3) TaxID=412133 RepID=A2EGR7_TRIV3|nr:armadillo (ARM) repeat-containing protein family [Trichomonas vaginalis G3]EAY08155.1 hypothetical protein TVAG_302420 [Trichomonas vaginalis G3]KAI5548713.1 armadillo (ARM) repeat-containing protein family [Trichomonas vaginalis G3]|eukprot:XP_001320378.1 hypothetical protein [Trichomonas vaginalis G3]
MEYKKDDSNQENLSDSDADVHIYDEVELSAINESLLARLNSIFASFDNENPKDSSQILSNALDIISKNPNIITDFVVSENIKDLVLLCKRKGSRKNVFRFISCIVRNGDALIPDIVESPIIFYLSQSIKKQIAKDLKYYALELIILLSMHPDVSTQKMYEAGIFHALEPNIIEENELTEISLQIICNATKIDDFNPGICENIISPLIDLVNFSENTIFITKSLRILTNILSNSTNISNQIKETNLIETLAMHCTSDDHYLQIAVFQFLGHLCPYGNDMYEEISRYNIFYESKKILLDEYQKENTEYYSIIMISVISFLRSWCDNENENYLNSLYSFLVQIPFESLYDTSAFDVKYEIMKLFLILSYHANADIMVRIITPDLIEDILSTFHSASPDFIYDSIHLLNNFVQKLEISFPSDVEIFNNIWSEYFENEIGYFIQIPPQNFADEVLEHILQ